MIRSLIFDFALHFAYAAAFGLFTSTDKLVPFSDAAVQFHWGDEIGDKSIGWHFDAENSALHIALSLQGNRTLLVREGPAVECVPDDSVERFPQQPGDVYISSPFAFCHGVAYRQCAFADRICAVQLRFALTCEQYGALRKVDPQQIREAHIKITKAMQGATIRVPTLQDMHGD